VAEELAVRASDPLDESLRACGFYSSSWGLLPYSFSRAPVEQITVRQVSYLSEKLPEIHLESGEKLSAIIPVPIDTGGVDTVVPVPARVSIPYDGPSPVQVRFHVSLRERGVSDPGLG
jgi:hypothetical protein